MSGMVSAVGADVTRFKEGDQVMAYTHLSGPGNSTFAEYCVVDSAVVIPKPLNLTHEEASTMPLLIITAAMLLRNLGYDSAVGINEDPRNPFLLVWGASGGIGVTVIQLARLFGLRVIAVCSAHNFDYVRSFGAEMAFDYHAADTISNIHEYTGFDLNMAVNVESDNVAWASVFSVPKRVAVTGTLPIARYLLPRHVQYHWIWAGTIFGPDLQWNTAMWEKVLPFMERGQVKPPRIEVLPGLEAIPSGLQRMADGKVSGVKLVCRVTSGPPTFLRVA